MLLLLLLLLLRATGEEELDEWEEAVVELGAGLLEEHVEAVDEESEDESDRQEKKGSLVAGRYG